MMESGRLRGKLWPERFENAAIEVLLRLGCVEVKLQRTNIPLKAVRGEMVRQRGAELWSIGKSWAGLNSDDSNERCAGCGRERLAARQDGYVVGQDVGLGKIGDTDRRRKRVQVFRLLPCPQDARGELTGEGGGKRRKRSSCGVGVAPVRDGHDSAEEGYRSCRQDPTVSGGGEASHGERWYPGNVAFRERMSPIRNAGCAESG